MEKLYPSNVNILAEDTNINFIDIDKGAENDDLTTPII